MTAEERLVRMEALCRRIERFRNSGPWISPWIPDELVECVDEADRIVKELPKPIDPDVLVVREIIASYYGAFPSVLFAAAHVKNGDYDSHPAMRRALAAYKAGKAARDE